MKTTKALALVAVLSASAPGAFAQDSDSPFSFFGRPFQNNESAPPAQNSQRVAQNSPSETIVRIEQLESQVRQLTGMIEQLQYRNQQLETQLRRMQDASAPQQSPLVRQPAAANSPLPPAVAPLPPAAVAGRRNDAFDPQRNPTAPGVPRTLGTFGTGTPPMEAAQNPDGEPPIGAPGGRQAGAPLDLSTFGANQPGNLGPNQAGTFGSSQMDDPNTVQSGALPPPPARSSSATGALASVLPPSATPRDQYDLGYGYVLRKDYVLAEDALQTFLTKFPNDKLVPDAQFWLGESRFQQQRYDAAAEAFLAVSTKHANNPKAPEAMLRLSQSLAALGQREMACSTLVEIGRKFPRASANVKQGVEREQKRVRC